MKRSGLPLLLSCLAVTFTVGYAQDAKNPIRRGEARSVELLPEGLETKLKLSGEQKEKIAKIEKEFAGKSKEAISKAQEKMQKARADKDRDAMRKAQEELAEAQKVRETYVGKVREVLDETQRKAYDEAGPAKRPGATAALLFGPAALERLGLSDQQKQQLRDLQTEFENKAKQVLTEEQRKKLEGVGKPRRPQ